MTAQACWAKLEQMPEVLGVVPPWGAGAWCQSQSIPVLVRTA